MLSFRRIMHTLNLKGIFPCNALLHVIVTSCMNERFSSTVRQGEWRLPRSGPCPLDWPLAAKISGIKEMLYLL